MKTDNGVESLCATCRFAEWKKTANGRRHPDGTGLCAYQFPDGPLPRWVNLRARLPLVTVCEALNHLGGGRWIYRRDYRHTVAVPCATHAPLAHQGGKRGEEL